MSVRNETHTNILILNKQYNKNLDKLKNNKLTTYYRIDSYYSTPEIEKNIS